jgi:hypothetical protein
MLSKMVARQVGIFLIALALVLPRVCIASAEIAQQSGVMVAHMDCAEHSAGMPAGHDEHDTSGGHHCCDQCQCCAAPTAAVPVATPFKLRIAPAAVAFANKTVTQRATLAFAILPINSHGPPALS